MNMFWITTAHCFRFAVSALLFLMLLSPAAHALEGKQLWQSRDQFVALEQQRARHNELKQPNDHPLDISPDRLMAMLASIEVSPADSGKSGQLMTSQALKLLVPHLVQGLRQATRDEDVTFAIIGLYKSALGFANNPKVTTGRIFYQGGRLNIIFGLVQKDFSEREDRRLAPFTPGSRETVAAGEWILVPQPGQNGFTQVRKDWLAFSDNWQAPVVQSPVTGLNIPAARQTAPARNSDTRTPAERLIILKELNDKELITEEEYRVKRQEVLQGL